MTQEHLKNDDTYHAKLSPSGSSRWLSCPYSVKLTAQYAANIVDRPSKAAAQGTAAHHVLEQCVKSLGKLNPEDFYNKKIKVDSFSITVDREMVENLDACITYIESFLDNDPNLETEQWLPAGKIAEHIPGLDGGTVDILVHDWFDNVLHIMDLKYGRGLVEAEASQLKLYAIFAAQHADIPPHYEIKLHVLQPRASHPDGPFRESRSYTYGELLYWFHTEVAPAAMEAVSEHSNPQPNPSESNCQWCDVRPWCRGATDAILENAKMDFGLTIVDEPENVTVDSPNIKTMGSSQLIYIWQQRGFVESMLGAVETELQERLNADNKLGVGELKLVRKRKNRRLVEDAELELGELLSEQEMYRKELKPMGQILSVLKTKFNDKGDYIEFEKTVVEKPVGDIEIATWGDKREAVNAALDFIDEETIEKL